MPRSTQSRVSGLFFACLAAATLGSPLNAAAENKSPYTIYAILSLTGPAAFVGQAVKKDLELIEAIANASGGIQGHPLRFELRDDEGNPQVTVQLTNDVIAKGAPLIIGSVVAGTCLAMVPVVAKNGPLMYCISAGIHPKRGSYVFSATVSVLDDAIGTIRFFRLKGWTRIAMITSTDAIGQEMDHSFATALALPENKIMYVVDTEHFNPSDISVAAQVARIKATNPQAVVTWVTGTAFGTLLRNLNDAGLDVPVSSSVGNMSLAQMAQYHSFVPRQLYFPGLRSMSREGTAAGPVRDAQTVYFNAFKRDGTRPDVLTAIAWDPTMIIIDALRHIGVSATAQQLRDYIDNLHGFAATSGMYDFGDPEQRGLTVNALVIDKWDPVTSDFIPASLPGAYLKK